jgi:hypothetical protein
MHDHDNLMIGFFKLHIFFLRRRNCYLLTILMSPFIPLYHVDFSCNELSPVLEEAHC